MLEYKPRLGIGPVTTALNRCLPLQHCMVKLTDADIVPLGIKSAVIHQLTPQLLRSFSYFPNTTIVARPTNPQDAFISKLQVAENFR